MKSKAEYQFFFPGGNLYSLEEKVNALAAEGWRIVMTAGEVIIVASPDAQQPGKAAPSRKQAKRNNAP